MPDDLLPPPLAPAPAELELQPEAAEGTITPPAETTTDPWVVRIVAAGLLLIAALAIGGLIAVAAFGTGIPDASRAAALVTAGAAATTAVGAAAALLASTRSRA